MACNDRQISQSDREAAYQQQRTGVMRALRPFSGTPSIENLVDYLNRELGPLLGAMRNATNTVFNHAVDNAPSANPLAFYFSTNTANADPTVGRIRLNQATQNTATIIRASQTNGRTLDVAPWLDVMAGGPTSPLGVVTLYDTVDPRRFLRFDLNTMTDQGAYWDLGVTIVESSHPSPFVDDEGVVIAFIAGVSAAGSTVPVTSLSPIATDTFVGNISGATATPAAVPLASVDSTSIVYDAASHEFRRAAVTGAVAIAANANTSVFSGIRDNGAAENDRTNLNFIDSTTMGFSVTDDSGNDELEISVTRGALTGAIVAAAGSTATVFAGILQNGAARTNLTNLNFIDSGSINANVTNDVANDELEISFERQAITGAIAIGGNTNTSKFSGILDDGVATPDRTNMNFVSSTTILSSIGDDAGNDEIEVSWLRAALTSEVTASQNSNACTVTRSTDFDASPWTGPHQFDGTVGLGTATTETGTGVVNVTLDAGSTRLLLSGTGSITLGTVSGCADGRILLCDFSGTGTHTIAHDGTSANAIACPGNTDLVIQGRGGFLLMGRSTGWKIIGVSRHNALTSEVTSTSANVATVVRSTDYAATPWTGPHTFNSTVSLGQKTLLAGSISPTTLSADQNDYTPTGWSTSNFVRLITSSVLTRTLTGAGAGSAGEIKILANIGAVGVNGVVFLSPEDGSSTAANRFLATSTGLAINPLGAVAIIYDGTSSRWRAISPF